MSMYTQLLDAAVAQRGHPARHGTLRALRRGRDQANAPAVDPAAVSVVLAREVAYDVALLELSEVMGIETDLRRFEQPQRERARLEEAVRDCWVAARTTTADAVRFRWPRCATPGSIVH